MSQSRYWSQKSYFYDIYMPKYDPGLVWNVYVFYLCRLSMYSIYAFYHVVYLCIGDNSKDDEDQAAKPEFHNFKDRFKSCFGTARL